jgi:hypothetical protein
VTGVAQVELLPVAEQFSISPTQAPRGAGLPLSLVWRVRDAVGGVTVSGLPTPQPADGSAVVKPTQTTSYTLSAKRLTPRTVRAQLAGQITLLRAIAGANTVVWDSAGADLARLSVDGDSLQPVGLSGDRYVGKGRSALYLVSTPADWANSVDVDLRAVAGTSWAAAACDYGITAVGATIKLEWSIPYDTAITVVNGSARHIWRHDESPKTFVLGPGAGGTVWQFDAPGLTVAVSPGSPWASAEAATDTGR